MRTSYVDDARLAANIANAIGATRLELQSGAIVTLDDAGARVHPLPIG